MPQKASCRCCRLSPVLLGQALLTAAARTRHFLLQDIERKGRLMPGNILLVDFDNHELVDDEAVSWRKEQHGFRAGTQAATRRAGRQARQLCRTCTCGTAGTKPPRPALCRSLLGGG